MESFTLNLFNTWQVTLPKKWRDKFDTKKFIATETTQWLVIRPLLDEQAVYYENSEGFGVYCENGMNPEEFISKIKQLHNG